MGRAAHGAVFRGNGVAVGVQGGVAQKGVEAAHEQRRLHVLQLLGYLVHLVPIEAQLLHQKHLPEAVLADGEQGQALAFGRELHAPVPLVRQEALVGQAAQHVRDGRRAGVQGGGNAVGAHAGGVRRGLGQFVDGLEVVFLGLAGHGFT